MKNDTLNALVLRHGDRMLQDAGWPPCVSMMQITPEKMPGWLVATGSLDAGQILALVTRLCEPLTFGKAALLTASARRLAGTPARLHLFPAQAYLHPGRLADCQVIRLPYAQEWLTAAECDDLLAFLLTLVNEREENIEGAGVITDLLRFPGDPVRRWFDRRVLRDVVREARAVNTQA